MRFFSLAIAFAVVTLSLAAPIPPILHPKTQIPETQDPESLGNEPATYSGFCDYGCPDWKREEQMYTRTK